MIKSAATPERNLRYFVTIVGLDLGGLTCGDSVAGLLGMAPNRKAHLMLACAARIDANMCRRLVGQKHNVREVHFLAAPALGQIGTAGLQQSLKVIGHWILQHARPRSAARSSCRRDARDGRLVILEVGAQSIRSLLK
jgi:hypothetical protein